MINFKNISLKLNSSQIFDNFSFNINKGEKAAIKGRSGKGKTTLFNLIMGFILPDSGNIYFNGILLNQKNITNIRKRIAWLPQNPGIIGSGIIRDEILLPFRFSLNKSLKPSMQTIEIELEKLNLDKTILNSSFDEISGGEKQRLGILLCKLLKREVLLLDEPTSALDKTNLGNVADYLCSQEELTVLSASHDEEWLKHCTQVIEI